MNYAEIWLFRLRGRIAVPILVVLTAWMATVAIPLLRNGETVQGTVASEVEQYVELDGRLSHWVTVRYVTKDGEMYSRVVSADPEVERGDQMTISYDPGNPGKPYPASSAATGWLFILLPGGLLVINLWVLAVIHFKYPCI